MHKRKVILILTFQTNEWWHFNLINRLCVCLCFSLSLFIVLICMSKSLVISAFYFRHKQINSNLNRIFSIFCSIHLLSFLSILSFLVKRKKRKKKMSNIKNKEICFHLIEVQQYHDLRIEQSKSSYSLHVIHFWNGTESIQHSRNVSTIYIIKWKRRKRFIEKMIECDNSKMRNAI